MFSAGLGGKAAYRATVITTNANTDTVGDGGGGVAVVVVDDGILVFAAAIVAPAVAPADGGIVDFAVVFVIVDNVAVADAAGPAAVAPMGTDAAPFDAVAVAAPATALDTVVAAVVGAVVAGVTAAC